MRVRRVRVAARPIAEVDFEAVVAAGGVAEARALCQAQESQQEHGGGDCGFGRRHCFPIEMSGQSMQASASWTLASTAAR